MIVISNHVKELDLMPIPDNVVIRVNMAHIRTKDKLSQIIKNIPSVVFLDFPMGRMRPPKPTLGLSTALEILDTHKHITYFAISNAERIESMVKLRRQVPDRVELVPKIETQLGVKNLRDLINASHANTVMLDKEDLYLDVKKDSQLFNRLVRQTRRTCKRLGVTVLELQGVIFSERKISKTR